MATNPSNPTYDNDNGKTYGVSTQYPLPVTLYSSADGETPSSGSLSNGDAGVKSSETNPIDTKNVAILQVDVTNETNATNNRYIDVRNYSVVKVQFTNVAGADTITHTLEATCQDDGTAPASCAYNDISQYGISPLTQSAGAASYTADIVYNVDVKGITYLNLKTVSSGGANDGDYSIYARNAY